MTLIHMDSEQVDKTILKLTKSRILIDQGIDLVKGKREEIRMNWYGDKASASFSSRLKIILNRLSDYGNKLEDLEWDLRHELDQWLEADAQFTRGSSVSGRINANNADHIPAPVLTLAKLQERMCGALIGTEQDRCLLIWGSPPTNAEQLAFMIQSLPQELPIVIMDIGNGEYLVLLRGSTTKFEKGSGLGSAIESMFGESSYQNSVVDALNNANLPPDAKLHFAGHSQGGMVAQNLAVDPRVTSQFEVETVTMYGSPDTFAPANPEVKYVSFEAEGDIFHQIDEIVDDAVFWEDLSAVNDVGNQAEVHVIPNPKPFDITDPVAAHRIYDDEGLLSGYDLPFETELWGAVAQEGVEISTRGPEKFNEIGAADVFRKLDEAGVI